MTPRARLLTERPFAMLLRLAVPNILAGLTQSSMLLSEGWYVGGIGRDALAGIALVFPLFMLTMMLSAGAFGGAISGAMARAIGAGDFERANQVVRLSVILGLCAGCVKAALMLVFAREIFQALGGTGAALEQAEAYAAVMFPGLVLIWVTNTISGALRGTGDMVRPAIGVLLVFVVHLGLLALQRYLGYPIGLAGAAWAMLAAYSVGFFFIIAVLALRGRSIRLSVGGWMGLTGGVRLLSTCVLAGTNTVMLTLYSLLATAVIGRFGTDWLAGYGIGVRLEMFIVPFVFGIGGAAMFVTGALWGAGRRSEAISIGWRASITAAATAGAIGVFFAVAPDFWWRLFTTDPETAAAASTYLERVGPAYAFFGLGLCLYFASQGTETLMYPVIGAFVRIVAVTLGFWLLSEMDVLTPQTALTVVTTAMVLYGVTIAAGMRFGPWRRAVSSNDNPST